MFQKDGKLKLILGFSPPEKYLLTEIQKYVKVDGIIFSVANFLESPSIFRRVIGKGLKDYYNFDDLVILDSGAWGIARRNLSISPDDVLSMAFQLRPDIFVSLDVTGKSPDEEKSFENFKYMYRKLDIPIMPVIHKPTLESVFKKYLDYDFRVFGHGGYTPNATSDTVQLISDLKYLQFLMKKYNFEKLIHVFGVAEPKFKMKLINLGDWVDGINWKIWGFFGHIWCPHCLQPTHITPTKYHGHIDFEKASSECKTSIEQKIAELDYSLEQMKECNTKGRLQRMTYNAVVLYQTSFCPEGVTDLFSKPITDWSLVDFVSEET